MGKKEDINNVTSLNHNLNNIVGIIETSTNLLNNADINTLEKRWVAIRDALMVTGKDRINKEIELFRNVRKAVEKVSVETYNDVYSQLLKTDKYYKSMLDILTNSKEYSEETKNNSFVYGNKMVYLLNDIIKKLEVIRIGLQKI